MKLSPLQLKHYFLTDLSLETNPETTPDNYQLESREIYPDFDCDGLESKVELSADPEEKDDPRKFMIHLAVEYKPVKGNIFPYKFKAKIIGFFEFSHDGELEERKRMVIINGTGILYGILRDKLLSLSSQFTFGAIMLPAADFRSLQKKGPEPKAKTARVAKAKNILVSKKKVS